MWMNIKACSRRGGGQQVSSFTDNRNGDVAIIFAVTLSVAVMSIGAAIDFARGLNTQTQLQAAADSAVLASFIHHAIPHFDRTSVIDRVDG